MSATCLYCGEPIERGDSKRARLYCDKQCGAEYRRIQNGTKADPAPLPASPCRCEEPLHVLDEDELRCLRCGHGVVTLRRAA